MEESSQRDDNTDLLEKLELKKEVETLRRAVGETDAKVDELRNELRNGFGAIMAHLGVPQSNNIRNPSDDEMEPAKSSATPFVVGSDISEKVKEKSKKKEVKKPIATGKPVKGEDDISSKLSATPFVSSEPSRPTPDPASIQQPELANYERVLREVETPSRAVVRRQADVYFIELREEFRTMRAELQEQFCRRFDEIMARLDAQQPAVRRNPTGQPPSSD